MDGQETFPRRWTKWAVNATIDNRRVMPLPDFRYRDVPVLQRRSASFGREPPQAARLLRRAGSRGGGSKRKLPRATKRRHHHLPKRMSRHTQDGSHCHWRDGHHGDRRPELARMDDKVTAIAPSAANARPDHVSQPLELTGLGYLPKQSDITSAYLGECPRTRRRQAVAAERPEAGLGAEAVPRLAWLPLERDRSRLLAASFDNPN